MMLSLKQFAKELTSQVKVLKLYVIFRFYETDDIKITNDSLVNVSEKLCLKYKNFFDVDKAEQ